MTATARATFRIDPELDGIREGTVLGGRYVVGRELGGGGMGLVVAAEDLVERRSVALKFLRRAAVPKDVERFLREARAVECLRSEHVTRLYDVGQVAAGPPFLVMELLRGETLAARADRSPPMSLDAILDAILQACEGVADAHARGIVHRDLKPTNLFLTEGADGPLLKILDFGVAKFLEAEDAPGLTTTGNVVGSPSFAAPEQLTAPRDVGPKIDIWALGVSLYWLLGRQLPFPGDTRVQVWMLILNSTPVPLHELRPDLPPALADAVMRCLEKNPDDRPADVGELARCLEPFTNRRPVSGRIAALLEGATRAALMPDLSRALPPPVRLEAPPSVAVAPPLLPLPPPLPGRRRAALVVFAAVTGTMLALVLAATLGPRRGAAPVAATADSAPSAATMTGTEPASAEPPGLAASDVPPGATTSPPGKMRRGQPRDPRRDPRSYR